MKIGLKYCGGCNPRFERSSIAALLRRDFPAAEIVSVLHGPADMTAIICGCPSACASADALAGPVFTLTSPEDYEELRRRIAHAATGMADAG